MPEPEITILIKDPDHKLKVGQVMAALLQCVTSALTGGMKRHSGGWFFRETPKRGDT